MNLCRLVVLFLLLAASSLFAGEARAGENLFNSRSAITDELSRVGGESVRYIKSPVAEYLPETILTLGAFTITYVYDREIRSKLSDRNSGVNRAADVGSFVGNPYLHLGGAALVYGTGILAESPRVERVGLELGEALFLTDATGFLLKSAVGRGRPATGDDRGSFHPFQFENHYDSLPSMHTASSFAVAHVLASETDNMTGKVLLYTAATFVGFSRLYQEEHWASDIILGAALGELAGRAVTGYRRDEKGSVRVAPAVSQRGTPLLALQGHF